MKTPKIANAISHIDEELINNAVKNKNIKKKTVWGKWSLLAACFAVLLIAATVAVPILLEDGNSTLPVLSGDNTTTNNGESPVSVTNDNGTSTAPTANQDTTLHPDNAEPSVSIDYDDTTTQNHNECTTQSAIGNEAALAEAYFYNVSDGVFSNYIICGKVIAEDKIDSKIDDVSVTAGWKNNVGEWLTTETLCAEVYLIRDISRDVAVALKFIDKGDALTTTHYYVIMNPDADLTSVKEYLIAPMEPNNPGDEAVCEVVGNEATVEYVVEYTSQFVNE